MQNNKKVIVRVNDRGPFRHERVIDLSFAAAYKLGYVENGSATVEVEMVTAPPVSTNAASPQWASARKSVYLQLGAFSTEEKAHKLRLKVQENIEVPIPPVHVVLTGKLHRVTLGPYASDADAEIDSARLEQTLDMRSIKLVR